LEKDPRRRLRDIGDARDLPDEPSTAAPSISRRGWLAAAALLVVSAALGVVAWRHFREEPPHVAMLFFPPPGKGTFEPRIPPMAVSPDGRRVAFEALVEGKQSLWVRDLDNPAPRMLASIESGTPEVPFWAPDSRRLGFFDGRSLKTIDVTGGPALTIADTGRDAPGSGSWNQDDIILFGTLGTPVISRVPAAGGTPTPVTELDKARAEVTHWAPWFLPDGRHFLYVTSTPDSEASGVYVGDLTSKARKQVVGFGSRAIYLNPGYLLYARDDTLMAQPFDTGKLGTTGDAVPVAEVDSFLPNTSILLGRFSASQNGVLMYTSGGVGGNAQLTWFDRTGRTLDTVGAPGLLVAFSLSPDGTTVAYSRQDSHTARTDIYTYDLLHGSESKLTFAGNNQFPVWSQPDGKYIFFYKNRQLYRKAANNTGPEQMVEAAGDKLPMDASRDGHYLFTITNRDTPKTSNDIWVLPLSGDRKPFAYVATEFSEGSEKLSPDGRWLAYQSNASRRFEIYVESFPQKGGRWQVSTGGGIAPVWSRDGRELYYYGSDGKIMVVAIKAGAQFEFYAAKPLFPVSLTIPPNASFEVSRDGRFLLPMLVEQGASAPMTVVLNWPEMLKKK
jgi:Tol biopolymer transport system component